MTRDTDPKPTTYAEWEDLEEERDSLRAERDSLASELSVRETWSGRHEFRDTPPSKRSSFVAPYGPVLHEEIWYWADGNPEFGDWESPRPSIHMPRYASRLLLEVTEVRIERLQDISEEDAEAEGCGGHPVGAARGWFHDLWDAINGANSWGANPWVWGVSFRKVEA